MIINWQDDWGDCRWSIEFKLDNIVADAGVRRTYLYPDGTEKNLIALPIPQVRKICKTILEFCSDEDIGKCDEAFSKNTKLWEVWCNEKYKRK